MITETGDAAPRTFAAEKFGKYPALRSSFGPWTVYTVALPADRLGDIVRAAPQAIAATDVQRGFDEKHARAIARFLIDDKAAMFGPITCSAPSKRVHFEELADGFGWLSFDGSPVDLTKILDGQHRRGAIEMIVDEDPISGVTIKRQVAARKRLRKSNIDVRIIAIDRASDRRRVFSWMQRQRILTSHERILLDDSLKIDAAVQAVVGQPEKTAATIPSLSALVKPLSVNGGYAVDRSEPWLLGARNVRQIMLHRTGRVNMSRTTEELSTAEWIQVATNVFTNDLPLLRDEWSVMNESDTAQLDAFRVTLKDRKLSSYAYHPIALSFGSRLMADGLGRYTIEQLVAIARNWSFDAETLEPFMVRPGLVPMGNRSAIVPDSQVKGRLAEHLRSLDL